MKALLIIIACVALALIFKVGEILTNRKMNSVGAKSNYRSGNMAKFDITNQEELKKALDGYKDLAD